MREIFFVLLTFVFLGIFSKICAASPGAGKTILYIPIDTRPVNLSQSVEVAEKLGYKVETPPEELLGNEKFFGDPLKLWKWLDERAGNATAAVVSSDAMIYGSLVGSRRHDLTAEEILERAKNFERLKKKFPDLPVYVFSTIMRTPRGTGVGMEPEYYRTHGARIFRYTALVDKDEKAKLSRRERKELDALTKDIPQEYLDDWLGRRERNFAANEYLIDLTKAGALGYFLVGCDDNAVYSQSDRESRSLAKRGAELTDALFLITSGADELGILMLARAINNDLHEIPFVSAVYNVGRGGDTIPDYTNEPIKISVNAAVRAAGGLIVPDHSRADFVVAVNTDIGGKTFAADDGKKNTTRPKKRTREFVNILKDLTAKNYPVGVADITFGNGADNALMEQLAREDLQFKLVGYGGWNTATNSSGFLIGTGVLARFMTEDDKNRLMFTRYLDDWAYQANIRQEVVAKCYADPGEGNPMSLDGKRAGLESMATELMRTFAKDRFVFPQNFRFGDINVTFPWNRTFECAVTFGK